MFMKIERKKWFAALSAALLVSGTWAVAQDDGAAEAVEGDAAAVEEAELDVATEETGAPAAPVKPWPSEIRPLATHALMLDVTSNGERLFAVGDRGTIVASIDGKDWVQIEAPVRSPLTAINFADAENGWAVGHDATILRTRDGGRSWVLQNFEPELEKPFLDVLFLDANHGFAVGAYGLLYVTTDGGDNWGEVDSPIREEELHFNAISRLANGDLFIAGEQGTLAVSSDAGATWTQVESPYEGSFFGALPHGDKGVLIFGLRGNVYTSADARGGWTKIEIDSYATLFGGTVLPGGGQALVGLAGEVRRIGTDGAITDIPVVVKEVDAQGKERIKELSGTLSAVIPFGGGLLVVGENGVVRVAAQN
jgi:photosystem II stability/assembly factor-like uncharacterized protein